MVKITCKRANPGIILYQVTEILDKLDSLLTALQTSILNGDWEIVDVEEKVQTKKPIRA
jgi:hypothetical protein